MKGNSSRPHHVVILGGGFGGLFAAQQLRRAPVQVTLVDRRNFHLFQPLLYQVATGGLSPGDIASPLRAVLNRCRNIRVMQAAASDIDVGQHRVILEEGDLGYDTLVVATGSRHHYFGNDQWEPLAPGLKTIEDALEMRRRIFQAFESAEWEPDPEKRRAWMSFVVVGGGPTGVELAGALGELAHGTLRNDFRNINPAEVQVLLLEGMDRLLPPYPPDLSARAEKSLAALGVTVQTNTLVTEITGERITVKTGDETREIPARTVLWAAGNQGSPLGRVLAKRTGAQCDRAGRVMVEPDLTLPGHPGIFVIGDLAHFAHQSGSPLPGIAPVALQQGRYVSRLIHRRLQGKSLPPFRYRDRGSMAVIGRHAAVADLGSLRFGGFPAWLIWILVHIRNLVEFENQLLVLIQWAWNYFTRKRGARLITGLNSWLHMRPDPQEDA